MYGLPKAIDLGFFLSRSIVQVCVGENDLVLHFDGSLRISVTSGVGCLAPDGEFRDFTDFREAAPSLFALLNKAVVSWEATEDGRLTLKFDGGGRLAIYDDSAQFESYVITNGSQVIVV
jgi:hypothetical protein